MKLAHRGQKVAGTKRGQLLEVKFKRYQQPLILKQLFGVVKFSSLQELSFPELVEYLRHGWACAVPSSSMIYIICYHCLLYAGLTQHCSIVCSVQWTCINTDCSAQSLHLSVVLGNLLYLLSSFPVCEVPLVCDRPQAECFISINGNPQ